MPTYDYACSKCGETFEYFQSIKADPLTDCPQNGCNGKGTVKRLLGTGGGFLFKGSGFYITDYRSDSYKKAQKKDAPTAKPEKSSSASSKQSSAPKGSPAQ